MMTFTTQTSKSRRAAALMTICLAALVIGACGGDSDNESSARAGESASGLPKWAYTPHTQAERQIVAMYKRYADAMTNANAKAACSNLSAFAQRGIGGKDMTCEERMRSIYANGKESTKQPYIVKLNVKGRTATGGVKTVTSKVYGVSFAKQNDGSWKIHGDTDG